MNYTKTYLQYTVVCFMCVSFISCGGGWSYINMQNQQHRCVVCCARDLLAAYKQSVALADPSSGL